MKINNRQSEILAAAERSLRRGGYDGLVLQDIADRLKIEKPTLFYYYKSKAEMTLAVLKEDERRFLLWQKLVSALPPGRARRLFFANFLKLSKAPSSPLCLPGALSADMIGAPKNVQNQLRLLSETYRTWLKANLRAGQRAQMARPRPLRSPNSLPNPRAKAGLSPRQNTRQTVNVDIWADLILCSLQGALQRSRVSGNTRPLSACVVGLEKLLRKEGL